MEDFTGLNVSRAKADIESFSSQAGAALNAFDDACTDFQHVLYQHWASPVAVTESTKYGQEMGALDQAFYAGYAHVVNGAIDAATMLAHANGATFPAMEKFDLGPGDAGGILADFGTVCEADKNGTVGMAVDTVKIALDIFTVKLNKVIGMVDVLPKSIAFYSPDGSMLSAYSTHISEFAGKIADLRDTLVSSITSCMETEFNNILMAKEQAADKVRA